MFKPSRNPKVAELTKSHRERSINLDLLKAIVVELPNHKTERRCAWCAEIKLNHGNQKYCSPNCSQSAMAWAYPQKEEALFLLLKRQDNKCNICGYQYSVSGDGYYSMMKRLKRNAPSERKPEVDHIVPISRGGASLGLENHQAICYSCHKAKTKIDNSGKRK